MRFIVDDLRLDATRLRAYRPEGLKWQKMRPITAWTGFSLKSRVWSPNRPVNVRLLYFNPCFPSPRNFRTSTPVGKVLQRRAPAAEIVGSGPILSRLAAAIRSNPLTP